MSTPHFPETVRKGSVTVKIYRTLSNRHYKYYTLAYWQDGVRKRPTFSNYPRAKEEALFIANRLGSKDADVLTLTSADRAAYLRARQLLKPSGVGIEMAAAQFADATRRLGKMPLSGAVDFYLERRPLEPKPRTVKQVMDELVEAKEADNLSDVYVKTLRYALGKFAERFPGNISEVSGVEIDSWLRRSDWSARSRNNLRRTILTLFRFAHARKYLPKDHDELAAVPIVKEPMEKIEIFTPLELTEILAGTDARFMPFVTLGAFSGIRHAEIQRLDWRQVRFEVGLIEVSAAQAKTASR